MEDCCWQQYACSFLFSVKFPTVSMESSYLISLFIIISFLHLRKSAQIMVTFTVFFLSCYHESWPSVGMDEWRWIELASNLLPSYMHCYSRNPVDLAACTDDYLHNNDLRHCTLSVSPEQLVPYVISESSCYVWFLLVYHTVMSIMTAIQR